MKKIKNKNVVIVTIFYTILNELYLYKEYICWWKVSVE